MGKASLVLGVISALAFIGFIGCALAMPFAARRFTKAMPPPAAGRPGWPVSPSLMPALATPEAMRARRRMRWLGGLTIMLFLVSAICASLARP